MRERNTVNQVSGEDVCIRKLPKSYTIISSNLIVSIRVGDLCKDCMTNRDSTVILRRRTRLLELVKHNI